MRDAKVVTLGCVVLLMVLIASTPLLHQPGRAGDRQAKPVSARELGKQWRYPGLSNDADVKVSDPNWVWEMFGPQEDKKNLDRTAMQYARPKAEFEKVWNFYAGKCGYAKKWEQNKFVLAIEKAEGNAQRMVLDQTPGMQADSGGKAETDFGLFTDDFTVHVQIRKVDAEQTAIRILTTIR